VFQKAECQIVDRIGTAVLLNGLQRFKGVTQDSNGSPTAS